MRRWLGTLSNTAAELKRRARVKDRWLPSLWLMTDDARLPDPEAAIRSLPPGAGVIFRHYGHKDRAMLATRLAALCRQRRLVFFVAGDWRLAAGVGAAGLHLPEYLARQGAAAGARLWRESTAAAVNGGGA